MSDLSRCAMPGNSRETQSEEYSSRWGCSRMVLWAWGWGLRFLECICLDLIPGPRGLAADNDTCNDPSVLPP